MRKEEQKEINNAVETEYAKMKEEMRVSGFNKVGRLRTCSAYVYETESYYILVSYSTPVAMVEKSTQITYDFLRMVYGYTSTSAQHIAKFRHDYTEYPWNNGELRWYSV